MTEVTPFVLPPNAKLTGFDVGRIARYYKDTQKAEKKANKDYDMPKAQAEVVANYAANGRFKSYREIK